MRTCRTRLPFINLLFTPRCEIAAIAWFDLQTAGKIHSLLLLHYVGLQPSMNDWTKYSLAIDRNFSRILSLCLPFDLVFHSHYPYPVSALRYLLISIIEFLFSPSSPISPLELTPWGLRALHISLSFPRHESIQASCRSPNTRKWRREARRNQRIFCEYHSLRKWLLRQYPRRITHFLSSCHIWHRSHSRRP